MSMLSHALGGGGGGVLGALNPLTALPAMAQGSLLGGFGGFGGLGGGGLFGGAPGVPGFNMPKWTGQDQVAFDQWTGKQKQLYTDQQKQLQDLLNKQRTNAYQNLTTGPEGEQFREYYNNLGLLNSGAFNKGLSDQFSRIEQGTEQQLGQMGIDQTNALAGLNLSGMQRQFGLEDQSVQAQIQRALANAQLQAGYRGQNLGFIGSLLGAGGNMMGGAMAGGMI